MRWKRLKIAALAQVFGQCAQGGISTVRLVFLQQWEMGLQVFAREMAVLTFAPLYWKVQVLSLILGQDSCSRTVPRAQTWERARFGDWFPYFDCPAEGRCFIQPTFNSGAFPRSWSWSIRPGTARWEAHSLANQHGKRDILDPFPEFQDAHAPPRSPFFTKRNLFHFI